MARRRFLVPKIHDGMAELRGDEARHLARVLRAEPGQEYEISDGAHVYLARIETVEHESVVLRVCEPIDTPQAAVDVTLYTALIKFDRLEWLVEKATELGVAEIVPVIAARSEKGLGEAARKRAERWRRIAHESSQQARRVAPPQIGEPMVLKEALARPCACRYFLDEQPGAPALLTVVSRHRAHRDSASLITGPEGGWTDAERSAATEAGWMAVSLGPLVLRAETAAITAAAVLTHAWWARQLE